MTASKLSIYNGALTRFLGERPLASVTEDRKPRRLLDVVWDNGGINNCLQRGYWNFALRVASISYAPSITPSFGYSYAITKPSDWVRTYALSASEYFEPPFLDHEDQAGYWWCDLQEVYVKYVSNGSAYGGDYSKWPDNFERFVECWFASQICLGLTQSQDRTDALEKRCKALLSDAKTTDATDEPTRFPTQGSWASSRRGSGRSRPRSQTLGY
jgi:hypothetical protein